MTRRAVLIAAAALAIAGLTVWLAWRWSSGRRERPLEPGWRAVVGVLAGDGVAAMRDGDSARARFSDPFGVAAAPDGHVFVADAGKAQRIRRIAPDGTVTTFAGGEQGFADGHGAAARFNTPSGLALDPHGTLYLADTGNNMIRRVEPDGTVSTLAGGLDPGYRDGKARQARFNGPVGVAVDAGGRVIVADTYNDRIRAVLPDGTVVTLAGGGEPGAVDGAPADARFHTPCGVAVDRSGNVFVADTGNNAVRLITPDGLVSTVGPPPPYGLLRPIGIALDPGGTIYVSDDRGRIVEITPGLAARVLAGSGPGYATGSGEEARFRGPAGISVAAPGRLIVADVRNALVRVVAEPARLDLRGPAAPRIAPAFDVGAFAAEPLLWPLDPMEGPFEITGTLGEMRGGNGSERFHAGIDVHAPEGAIVRIVRNGTVSHPVAASDFGTLNESVRVGPVAYVHLRTGRSRDGELLDRKRFVGTYGEDGGLSHIRVRRGARFWTGDAVGTVNQFNHVHLNVGWPGEEYNPLRFGFLQYQDTIRPTIARGGIRLVREDGEPLVERERGRLIVAGRVHVVVDAWDQVDGNERRRRLGVYRLGYQVFHADGSPVEGFEHPRETIRFDRLAPDDTAPRAVYAAGSGIPFFGRRSTRFLYTVTNSLREGVAREGVWDTASLPPGDYTLRVIVSDIAGNEAVANRDLAIRIGSPK